MTVALPGGRSSFVLHDMSWDYYDRTLQELEESGQNVRITYDRGRMEFMSPSNVRERIKKIIAQFIELYSNERDLGIIPAGSVTCRRDDLEMGLEPDECYYVHSEAPPVQAELDLSIYPPPDLAVEVDITSRSILRQPIYGALGVPEFWQYDGKKVVVLHRLADGTYRPSPVSLAFPKLSINEFNRFFQMAVSEDQRVALKSFRNWLNNNPQV